MFSFIQYYFQVGYLAFFHKRFLIIGDKARFCFERKSVQSELEPVSRKSRNFTGYFRVSRFPLYLKNGGELSQFAFCYLQNLLKVIDYLEQAVGKFTNGFRARKVFGTFEKRAPGFNIFLPMISRSGFSGCIF